MQCYTITDVGNDGYVKLLSDDKTHQKELPLVSTKIMFESGNLFLINPERIYQQNIH